MKCNIDASGKAVRLRIGIVAATLGLGVLGLTALGVFGGRVSWASGIALVAVGLFGIFEARAGWCIVRAMGIKTRI